MLCAKFSSNLPLASGSRKKFKVECQYIFTIISPGKMQWPFSGTKLPWRFWRTEHLKGVNGFFFLHYFHYFTIIKISHWKNMWSFFWKNFTSPCLPRILCVKSMAVDTGPVVLEKNMKMWKVYYNENNRQWTFLRSEKLTSAFGSDELKKVQKYCTINL